MKKTTQIVLAVIVIFVFNTKGVYSQNINTIAGDGTLGYTGNGGQATAAELNYSSGVAVDGAGNIYIADQKNQVVRKVTPAGIISTIAGNGSSGFSGDGGQATAAELTFTPGVAVDGSGNIFITDYSNSRIRKVTPSGIINTIAGNGASGYSGDGVQATSAEINNPTGVAVDSAGNAYIADFNNSRIRKITPSGIISTIAGNGVAGYTGDGAQATNAELNFPWGLAVDGLGNIYIADRSNNVIRKVNSAGVISTIAGTGTAGYTGDGGQATAAELNYTPGVTVDGFGNVYAVDQHNNVIRKIDINGIISTYAGSGTLGFSGDGGPSSAAKLQYPSGVTVDSYGVLYIADQYNHRIRKVNSTVSVSELNSVSSSALVFPNPSNGLMYLKYTGIEQHGEFMVTDITGRIVVSKKVKLTSLENIMIDGSELAKGLYLYKVTGSNNTIISTGKFIITK